ncbi:MAG: cytochrome, partial [Mycobacterium sp.]|nr:cytochrome [Mycobacterium sp.]
DCGSAVEHDGRSAAHPDLTAGQLWVDAADDPAVEDGLRRRARALLDYVESGAAFDFLTDIAAELPMQMICILLGVPESDRHWLFEAIEPRFDFGGSSKASISRMSVDLGLLPTAIEEMVRWTSPSPSKRRTATRDVRLADESIQCGQKVLIWEGSANRDVTVFDDPSLFDITR